MDEKLIKKALAKQGYRFVGDHSAMKLCLWCKRALLNDQTCYKHKFYGIQSWRCVQCSVSVFNCFNNCQFCWRDLDYTLPGFVENPGDPEKIIDGLIEQHKLYLQSFKGNAKLDFDRFEEAMQPKHFAISLAGDATLYPLLPDFIRALDKRGITSFVVTNGLMPEVLKKIKPTQLYISLDAYNKELYDKVCRPSIDDAWERLMESLKLLKKFERSCIRLTLFKNLNIGLDYAELLKQIKFKFLEVKAGMAVGYAQYRLLYKDMLRHSEIQKISDDLAERMNWKIIDESSRSRVCLLMKEDLKERKLNLD